MTKVTNTTQELIDNPDMALVHLVGGEAGIAAEERRGQHELINSTVLPLDGIAEYRIGGKYEKLGIKIGELVEGDALFVRAELPPGWTKKATDHSMHSRLCDEQGRERINIFYKAASYDRSASIWHPSPRYIVRAGNNNMRPDNNWAKVKVPMCEYVIVDVAKMVGKTNEHNHWVINDECILHVITEAWDNTTTGEKEYEQSARVEKKAREFMIHTYPEALDPLAYW